MRECCAMNDLLTHPDLLLALVAYALVTSITPGPNNLMLMASGANFGLRRTVPHMLGVTIGQGAMTAILGLGVAAAFHAWPPGLVILKLVSTGYMLWLAWKIAHAAAPGEGRAAGKPLTFLQAAGFQWVNPKAVAMSLTALALYAGDGGAAAVAGVVAVFAVVNLPSISLWAAAGQGLRHWLAEPVRLTWFNRAMAAGLVASLWPVLRM